MAVLMDRALKHSWLGNKANLCWSPDGKKKKTFGSDRRQSWPDVAYWPSTQLVEKKQMLRVSRGLSCVNSGERVWGSDSPVREELSTFTGIGRKEESTVLPQWDWRTDTGEKWGVETDRVEMKEAALISNKCRDVTLLSCQNCLLVSVIFHTFLYRGGNVHHWSPQSYYTVSKSIGINLKINARQVKRVTFWRNSNRKYKEKKNKLTLEPRIEISEEDW